MGETKTRSDRETWRRALRDSQHNDRMHERDQLLTRLEADEAGPIGGTSPSPAATGAAKGAGAAIDGGR